jgi:hypothetical protein
MTWATRTPTYASKESITKIQVMNVSLLSESYYAPAVKQTLTAPSQIPLLHIIMHEHIRIHIWHINLIFNSIFNKYTWTHSDQCNQSIFHPLFNKICMHTYRPEREGRTWVWGSTEVALACFWRTKRARAEEGDEWGRWRQLPWQAEDGGDGRSVLFAAHPPCSSSKLCR